MRAAFWLARRELLRVRARAALGVAVVGAPIALGVAVEVATSAREAAAAIEIDRIGAPLRIVPAGVTAGQIARSSSGGRNLSEDLAGQLESVLSHWVREIRARLVFTGTVGGASTPIVGLDGKSIASLSKSFTTLGAGEVAVGFALAEARGIRVGDAVTVSGHGTVVVGILPQTTTSIDAAVVLPLHWAQEVSGAGPSVNVIDVYLRPSAPIEHVESFMRQRYPDVELLRKPRGEIADRKTGEALRFNRWVLYSISGVTIFMFLTIGSYLNVADRRHEIATLVAIGSTTSTLQLALILRAVLVVSAGALIGSAVGLFAALTQTHSGMAGVSWTSAMPTALLAAGLALSVAAATPGAFYLVNRDLISSLQDG